MARTNGPTTLQYLSTVTSASVILLPLIVAKGTELYLKSSNPGADIRPPVMIAGGATLVVCLILAVVFNVMTQNNHGSARRSWTVLVVQLLLGGGLILAQLAVNRLS